MKTASNMFIMVMLMGALIVADIVLFISLGVGHFVPWLVTLITIAIPFLIRNQESKSFVQWKEEYATGIEQIDNDHKRLLKLINDLETAIHYNAGDTFEREALDGVIAYTKTHFKSEEELMKQHGYFDFEAHKGQHDQMISNVEVFVRDYERKGHKALPAIAEHLKLWLIQHINGTDKKYVPFLKSKGV